MKHYTAKIFMNGRSQAVRLPKECRIEDADEVTIYRSGNRLTIEPIHKTWDAFLSAIDLFPDDFEMERSPTDKKHKDLF